MKKYGFFMCAFGLKTRVPCGIILYMKNGVDLNQLISKLNDEQVKPVLDTEGAVLVIAGAGSGKTRVLTTRIAYLVSKKGVHPSNILAITFTNKAAGEMKNRLQTLCGDVSEMWVSTIHSMCVRILRSYINLLGYDRNFTIYDETDKDKALKRVLEELNFEPDKLLKVSKNVISEAKNECVGVEEFRKVYADLRLCEEIATIYQLYDKHLARSNALDFDDLLFLTYKLFVKFPEVADSYASQFQYIHIDEFQDTNRVQFAIANRLSIKHGNIFAVGDDDQSIYGWRGAKIENILKFDDIYRGAKIYKLERNYRSTKKIISLANCIIKNNTMRREKQLWTDNDDGCKIETFVGNDENNEAAYTAIQIKSLMDRNPKIQYKDFAVFMRLNALSRAYEQEFTKYGIPYTIFGGFRFFERKEIKDVLAYLKVINNPCDDESFLRAVSTPKRGIGEKTLHELFEFANSRAISVYEAIDYVDLTTLSSNAKTKLINFKILLISFKDFSINNSVPNLIKHVLEKTDFIAQYGEDSEENTQRRYNISELLNSAEQFCNDNYGVTLADYLNSVTLSSDTDSINDGNVVTIATIHSAKGLEYPYVFVCGLDEKILPASRSSVSDEDLEEERRLMYVAVTRAKERLFLTRANSRYMYGSREFMVQSRFLKEGKEILFPNQQEKPQTYTTTTRYDHRYNRDAYQEEDFANGRNSGGYSSSYAKRFLDETKPKTMQSVSTGRYKSGVKVKHKKFGEGTIIAVKGEGDNLIVDVAFKGVGIKSLSVKFAPMEIV